jgi:hypothetical protein
MKRLIQAALLLVTMSCALNPFKESGALGTMAEFDSLRVELEEMYTRDQEIRHIIFDSIGFDSPDIREYFARMNTIDSLNQIRLSEIMNQYGWIAASKIGEEASDAIFYIIQHSNPEMMEKYYPELKALAATGEAKKTHAAMMEDRLLMWKGKKQKYGTQATSTLRENKTMAIWPIENPDSVNLLRRSAGIELTVEENAARLHAEYDRDERLPG